MSVAESKLVPSLGRADDEEAEMERLRDFLGGEVWESTGCIKRPFSIQNISKYKTTGLNSLKNAINAAFITVAPHNLV